MDGRIEVVDLGGDFQIEPLGRQDGERAHPAAGLDHGRPEPIERMSDRRGDAHAGNDHAIHFDAFASTRVFTARQISPTVAKSDMLPPACPPVAPSVAILTLMSMLNFSSSWNTISITSRDSAPRSASLVS